MAVEGLVELSAAGTAFALSPWILIPAAIAAAWAGVSRRRGLVALFLGTAALAVVGPLLLAFAEVLVHDADDLLGTSWTVAEIDGDTVPEGEVYLFLDAESASLVTHIVLGTGGLSPRCRESVSEVVMDTDGHALNFTGFDDLRLSLREQRPCDEALSGLHHRIALALRHNESWRATGEELELLGTSRIRLLQAGRPSD